MFAMGETLLVQPNRVCAGRCAGETCNLKQKHFELRAKVRKNWPARQLPITRFAADPLFDSLAISALYLSHLDSATGLA
jgi:hypothetical protein